MTEFVANENQNTPSIGDLEAQIAADEAARFAPQTEVEETPELTPEPEAKAEPEPQEEEAAEPDHKAEDEFEKRMKRMAFEKRQAERQAREARAEIERLRAGQQPDQHRQWTPEDIEAEIDRKAAAKAATEAYNSKANAIWEEGVGKHTDFAAKVTDLVQYIGLDEVSRRTLVDAAEEAGDAAGVLYHLSKNLDEAERIVAMSPARMGAALGKIAAKLSAPPPPRPQSKAPAPIKPVTGSPKAAELPDDKMPLDEYMKREDERFRARRW